MSAATLYIYYCLSLHYRRLSIYTLFEQGQPERQAAEMTSSKEIRSEEKKKKKTPEYVPTATGPKDVKPLPQFRNYP